MGISEETAKKELNNLVCLYKKGKDRMIAFSTELGISNTVYNNLLSEDKEKKDKVADSIKKVVTKESDNYSTNYTSEELKQVYNDGFFKSEDFLNELGDNTSLILGNVFNKK